MTDRSYTVKEIDDLRECCRWRLLIGSYRLGGMIDGDALKPVAVIAEEMVRTHMLAGHTAEDLIASEE